VTLAAEVKVGLMAVSASSLDRRDRLLMLRLRTPFSWQAV